jgi:hypothetical protein
VLAAAQVRALAVVLAPGLADRATRVARRASAPTVAVAAVTAVAVAGMRPPGPTVAATVDPMRASGPTVAVVADATPDPARMAAASAAMAAGAKTTSISPDCRRAPEHRPIARRMSDSWRRAT